MLLDDLNINVHTSRKEVFQKISDSLKAEGFEIVEVNIDRPWGGYIRMTESQLEKFLETFFKGVNLPEGVRGGLNPTKILIMEPGRRFSWQVHQKRYELWRAINKIGTYLGDNDTQPENYQVYSAREVIPMKEGTRHRLQGLENWGLVAEIWVHINPSDPSTEEDVKRIEDDFGRS